MTEETGEPLPENLPPANPPFLDGSWEKAGRSPVVAAIIGVLIIGAIYFNGQSLITTIAMLASGAFGAIAADKGGFVENLTTIARLKKNPILISVFITQYALMLLPTIYLVRKWHSTHVRKYIRLRRCSFREIGLAILATVSFFPLNIAISGMFIRALHVPDFLLKINNILFTAQTGKEFLWLTIVIAVTPALCEEILFRGYFQRSCERVIGWKSVILAGGLFGLYHMQPLGLLSLSTMGLLFGYLYFRSGSLLTSMAAHFTNNFLVLLVNYVTRSSTSVELMSGYFATTAIIAGSLVAEVVILRYFHTITKDKKTEDIQELSIRQPAPDEVPP